VSNLNAGVTEEDIKELFGDVGELVSARLQRGPNGRSSGSAYVCYVNMKDALEAVKRYNGVPLDDMPLKITLASSKEKVMSPSQRAPAPSPSPPYVDSRPGNNFNNGSGSGNGQTRSRGTRKNRQQSSGNFGGNDHPAGDVYNN
jgi:THO complex subunit 4